MSLLKMKQITEDVIDTEIQGIDCFIRVDSYDKVEPYSTNPFNCPSADDYYGYEEMEYTMLDYDLNEAQWLEKRMTARDDEKVRDTISSYYEERFSDEY